MADKQNPDDPGDNWRYPGKESPDESSSEATQQFPPPDDDRTGVIRSQSSGTQKDHAAAGPEQSGGPGDDATRVMGVQPRPDDRGAQRPTGERQSSFGGTYRSPPPPPVDTGPEPGFATPAQPGPQQSPTSRPPGRQTRPPRRPRRRRNWWLRSILALVLIWIAFLVAVPIWAYSNVNKVGAEPSGDRPDDTPGTTYLLVGSDSRADLSEEERSELGTGDAEGQRTDTILLLHVPDGDGPNLLLSLPRDSYVEIPGEGENKINAAYAFGGPALLVETVELNTGLRVDNYVEVGFVGFVDVVDSVGGIEVCPETKIDDPKAGGLELDPGCQDVDGGTALQYSRSRDFGDGDITRALHQREVISAVGKKAASWQTVVLPWRYFKINKAGAESLRVGEDVGPVDLARFAWAMAHSSGGDAKQCVVPISSLGGGPGGSLLWDDARADEIFGQIADDDTGSISCAGQ
ncbi:MAG: LCP family protein [Actinomycetota bacterium]|nr:LCP family protein [Actinomycetota bacterium]